MFTKTRFNIILRHRGRQPLDHDSAFQLPPRCLIPTFRCPQNAKRLRIWTRLHNTALLGPLQTTLKNAIAHMAASDTKLTQQHPTSNRPSCNDAHRIRHEVVVMQVHLKLRGVPCASHDIEPQCFISEMTFMFIFVSASASGSLRLSTVVLRLVMVFA